MFSQGFTITLVELPILPDFRKLDRLVYSKLRAAALGGKVSETKGREYGSSPTHYSNPYNAETKLFIASLRKKEIKVIATMHTYSSKRNK